MIDMILYYILKILKIFSLHYTHTYCMSILHVDRATIKWSAITVDMQGWILSI